MALIEILKYPDAKLRQETRRVESFNGELRRLVSDMTETMYAARGAGLAAIQVGSDLRLFIVEATIAGGTQADAPLIFVNPEIVSLEGTQTGDEGCLSFPGIFLPVKRALRCTARAHDLDGCELLATAEGLYARAIQHEIDHLDGKLLVDYAGPVKRRMIKRYMDRREWEVEGQNIRGELDDSPL
ncbi:MAG: peptide deformylase [Myxococcota bacterium]